MSFGRMNTFIKIIQTSQNKDAAGFSNSADTIIAEVRAYREDRHGTKMWANRAAFSTATCLFRFRIIPSVTVTDKMEILCGSERFRITSVEDVKNRGMYVEVLAERLEASKHGSS
ncbi:MAG: head-tail adaptor protein [Eubacteriales bacterium]|nr:head-tail adaptor protein [Eubacteriales bacterium]